MSCGDHSERRAPSEHKLAAGFAPPFWISRARAWKIVAAGSCVTGIADYLTGDQAWFGPIYLLFVGCSAWWIGRREAVGIGLGCMAMALAANGLSLYPYGSAVALWNFAMRVLAVIVAVALIDTARKSYIRQWWLARTDPLTGALNRLAFFEAIEAVTYSSAWNLMIYADLDGLKRLNDKHGHAVGDKCLRTFVAELRKEFRREDLLARMGGDEFLIYMIVNDEAGGKAAAARLHETMNRITAATAAALGCSIGAVILPPGPRTIDREIQLADELMYEAKLRGGAIAVATAHGGRELRHLARHSDCRQILAGDIHGRVIRMDGTPFEDREYNVEPHKAAPRPTRSGR